MIVGLLTGLLTGLLIGFLLGSWLTARVITRQILDALSEFIVKFMQELKGDEGNPSIVEKVAMSEQVIAVLDGPNGKRVIQ